VCVCIYIYIYIYELLIWVSCEIKTNPHSQTDSFLFWIFLCSMKVLSDFTDYFCSVCWHNVLLKRHTILSFLRETPKNLWCSKNYFCYNTMLNDQNLFWKQTRFLTILHKNVTTIEKAWAV